MQEGVGEFWCDQTVMRDAINTAPLSQFHLIIIRNMLRPCAISFGPLEHLAGASSTNAGPSPSFTWLCRFIFLPYLTRPAMLNSRLDQIFQPSPLKSFGRSSRSQCASETIIAWLSVHGPYHCQWLYTFLYSPSLMRPCASHDNTSTTGFIQSDSR